MSEGRDGLRVFISSTERGLESHRSKVIEHLQRLQVMPIAMEYFVASYKPTLEECLQRVRDADVLVLIVAGRYGWIPDREQGGDGEKSITRLEFEAAREMGKPVFAFLSDDVAGQPQKEAEILYTTRGQGEAMEVVRKARLLKEFRDAIEEGGLIRDKFGSPDDLAARVVSSLTHYLLREGLPNRAPIVPRRWSGVPPYPSRPYPLLEQYEHPDLLGGRDQDIAAIVGLLEKPRLVLCVHAVSGAGKSSLLGAGVVPALGRAGRPVIHVSRPDERGLGARALRGLAETSRPLEDRVESDPLHFALLMDEIAMQGRTPVIILDQFELVMGDCSKAREEIGPLLAATAARVLPGDTGHPCHWLLSYRQEFHGAVLQWLRDVLRDARMARRGDIELLPTDLKRPGYYHEYALPVLGDPRRNADPERAAERAFQAAISKPLRLERSRGRPLYPWRFSSGAARELARAFARARVRRPRAPLAPELQVVLARLLEDAVLDEATSIRMVQLDSEDNVDALVGHALGDHLRRKLDQIFREGSSDLNRRRRTAALMLLHELIDADGHLVLRDAEQFQAALTEELREALRSLQRPDIRLVVRVRGTHSGDKLALPHDSLAEVVKQIFSDPEERRRYDLDEELVDLQRTIALLLALHREGEAAGTSLEEELFRSIAEGRHSLSWGAEQRAWWGQCEARREREHSLRRRRRFKRVSSVAALVTLVVAIGYLVLGPLPDLQSLRRAETYGEAFRSYQRVASYPGRRALADRELAAFCNRQSSRAAARGEITRATAWRLRGLQLDDTEESCRELAVLLASRMERLGRIGGGDSRVRLGSGEFALSWSSGENRASRWLIQTGEHVLPDLKHQDIEGAAFSSNGQAAATWSSEYVRVWDASSGLALTDAMSFPRERIYGVATSEDGRTVATVSRRVKAQEFERRDGSCGRTGRWRPTRSFGIGESLTIR